ncbi:hypothetical protein FQA39_LY17966 [Lamprigera yunnana]|nr:hypothetical protein FQA39_LY17966 [Lamprigera yunnana]
MLELQMMFKLLWLHNIIDVIFLFYNENFIELVTANPQHPSNKCEGALNHYTKYLCNSTSVKTIRFPKPLRKYHNCNLTYYYFDKNVDLPRYATALTFTTYFLLNSIQEILNINIIFADYKTVSTRKPPKFILYMHNFFKCARSKNTCSVPYFQSGYLWTVPPPKLIHPLSAFKIIFKENVWILILLTFIITSVSWWLISGSRTMNAFFGILIDIYSLTIFGLLNRIPTQLPLRIVFLAYVYYSIHIQSVFTSNLVRLLTVPQFEAKITSLTELANSQYSILAFEPYYNFFTKQNESRLVIKQIVKKLVYISDEQLSFVMTNKETFKNYATVIMTNDYYTIMAELQTKINTIIDNSISGLEKNTLTGKLGCYTIPSINKVISILLESGLITYQETIYKQKKKSLDVYMNNITTSTDPIVINLTHIYPVFVFLAAGLIIATTVFFLELLTYYVINKYASRKASKNCRPTNLIMVKEASH